MIKIIMAQGTVSNSYITSGKRYLAEDRDNGLGFIFIDDHGDSTYSTWKHSSHQNGGDWTRIEKEIK